MPSNAPNAKGLATEKSRCPRKADEAAATLETRATTRNEVATMEFIGKSVAQRTVAVTVPGCRR
jgi:hypothetical protein